MTADLVGLAAAIVLVAAFLGSKLFDLWERAEKVENALDTLTEGKWRAYPLWDEIFRNPEA